MRSRISIAFFVLLTVSCSVYSHSIGPVLVYQSVEYYEKDLVGVLDEEKINLLNDDNLIRVPPNSYYPPAVMPVEGDWIGEKSYFLHNLSGIVETFVFNSAFDLFLKENELFTDIVGDPGTLALIDNHARHYAIRSVARYAGLLKSNDRSGFNDIVNDVLLRADVEGWNVDESSYKEIVKLRDPILFLGNIFPPFLPSGDCAPWVKGNYKRSLYYLAVKKAYEMDYNSIVNEYKKYRGEAVVVVYEIGETAGVNIIESMDRGLSSMRGKEDIFNIVKNIWSDKNFKEHITSIRVMDVPSFYLFDKYNEIMSSLMDSKSRPTKNKREYIFVFDFSENEEAANDDYILGGFVDYFAKIFYIKPYVERVLKEIEVRDDITIRSAFEISSSNHDMVKF